MLRKIRKSQSIVEYLLVLAGIILAVLWGANLLANRTRGQLQTSGDVVNATDNVIRTKLVN